jgi:acetyl esterase/lipase
MPAGIVAFSPSSDMTRSGASMQNKEELDPFFTRDGILHTTAMYLGGADAEHPLVSPALSGDFAGLPPLLLQVGTDEVLLDDAVHVAERARDAEVDVILDVVARVPHVFVSMVGMLDEADAALERAALFIHQRLR